MTYKGWVIPTHTILYSQITYKGLVILTHILLYSNQLCQFAYKG